MQPQREGSPQPKGKLHKGTATLPIKSSPGAKPVSSIPAKFETVLYTGPREQKGFLSESRRFHNQEHDLPGPGTYSAHGTLEFQHDSIGKKGFGTMVSSSQRFNHRPYYTGPGPAEYKRHDSASRAIQDRSFSRAAASAAFQAQNTLPRKPSLQEPVPGPGAYDSGAVTRTGQKLDYLAKHGASSAFKAGAHQLILLGNIEAPPPTSYTLTDPWEKSRTEARSRAGTSSFGGGRGGQSVGSMMSNLDTLLFGAAPSSAPPAALTPGPGHYELQDFASIRSSIAKQAVKPSPAFQQPHMDRAEVRPRDDPPAVGPRDAPAVRNDFPHRPPRNFHSPQHGVASPFKSTAPGHVEYTEQRSAAASTNAPGPAYYDPNISARKSFHSNMKKHYLSS